VCSFQVLLHENKQNENKNQKTNYVFRQKDVKNDKPKMKPLQRIID